MAMLETVGVELGSVCGGRRGGWGPDLCVWHSLCLSPPPREHLLAPRLKRCPSPSSLGRPWETRLVWALTFLSEEMLRGWKADAAVKAFFKAVGEEGAGK